MSSALLLALPAISSSALGAKATLSQTFVLEHEDGTYYDPLEIRFDSANCEVAPENEIQKNWLKPIFDLKSQMILKLKPTDVRRFNAYQDKFGSQWLNVIPCKNLRLKL